MNVLTRLTLRVLNFLAAFFVCVSTATAATSAQVDSARLKALAWLYAHQNGEGNWSGTPEAQAAVVHEALLAMKNAGVKGYPYYAAFAYLTNLRSSSMDTTARQLHAVSLEGGQGQIFADRLMKSRQRPVTMLWGAYPFHGDTVVDTALALRALASAQFFGAAATADFVTQLRQVTYCVMLERQLSTGGWTMNSVAYYGYNTGSPLIEPQTKASIFATRAVYDYLWEPQGYGYLSDNDYCVDPNQIYPALGEGSTGLPKSISQQLNAAIAWLKTLQKPDGGIGQGASSTVLETVWAYKILSGTPEGDRALDYLIAQQDATAISSTSSGGSWGGSALATFSVLADLPPQSVALVDSDGDGIPDEVEALLGTNASVADSRWMAKGNVSGVPPLRLSTPPNLKVFVGRTQAITLGADGGVKPYIWAVGAGPLPPGLSLNASSGVISGVPFAIGTFPFSYSVVDSQAMGALHADGYISVSRSNLKGDLNGDGLVDATDRRIASGFSQMIFDFLMN